MDSKFGPDGALYVQVYDGFFRANPNVGLYRFDYIGGPDTPGPDPQATPAGQFRVAFSIGKSGGVSYRWDVRRRRHSSTSANPTNNYGSAGTFDVTLTVTYADGDQGVEDHPGGRAVAYATRPPRCSAVGALSASACACRAGVYCGSEEGRVPARRENVAFRAAAVTRATFCTPAETRLLQRRC